MNVHTVTYVLTPCSICRDLSHGFTEYNGNTVFIAGELKIACTWCETVVVLCVVEVAVVNLVGQDSYSWVH